jgi:hypothetical protein
VLAPMCSHMPFCKRKNAFMRRTFSRAISRVSPLIRAVSCPIEICARDEKY